MVHPIELQRFGVGHPENRHANGEGSRAVRISSGKTVKLLKFWLRSKAAL